MPPKCHLVQSVAWASGQCGGGRVPLGPPSKPALRGEEHAGGQCPCSGQPAGKPSVSSPDPVLCTREWGGVVTDLQ